MCIYVWCMKTQYKTILFLLSLLLIFPITHASSTIFPYPSTFWAGYTAIDPYPPNSINGSWVVQATLPTLHNTYGSQWIGFGAAGDTNLLQIGTRSNYYLIGGANYSASYERVSFFDDLKPLAK